MIWNSETGDLLHTLSPLKDTLSDVNSIDFDPEGNWVSSLDHTRNGRRLHIWKLTDGNLWDRWRGRKTKFVPLILTQATAATYSPDGRWFAYAKGGSIYLRDRQAGGADARFLGAKQDELRELRFSANGKRLVSLNREGLLQIWSVERKFVLHSTIVNSPNLSGGFQNMAISADGERVLFTGASSSGQGIAVLKYVPTMLSE